MARKKDPFAKSNHREPWEPQARFPILFLEMEPGDEGWEEGWRWQVEQVDEDLHYFHDRERAEDFIIREGLKVVSIEAMEQMREEGTVY